MTQCSPPRLVPGSLSFLSLLSFYTHTIHINNHACPHKPHTPRMHTHSHTHTHTHTHHTHTPHTPHTHHTHTHSHAHTPHTHHTHHTHTTHKPHTHHTHHTHTTHTPGVSHPTERLCSGGKDHCQTSPGHPHTRCTCQNGGLQREYQLHRCVYTTYVRMCSM